MFTQAQLRQVFDLLSGDIKHLSVDEAFECAAEIFAIEDMLHTRTVSDWARWGDS